MTKESLGRRIRDQRLAEIRSKHFRPETKYSKKVDPVPTRPDMASMVEVVREYLENHAVTVMTLSVWSGIPEGDIRAELVKRGIEDAS